MRLHSDHLCNNSRNLQWILDNDIEEADLSLVFCADGDHFGLVEAIELLPNGKNIPVTNQNKVCPQNS